MKISLILDNFTWTMPRNNAINLKGFGSINQNPSPLSPWKKEMTALSANIQVNLTKQSPGQFSWPFHFASLIFCPFFWNNLLKGMLAVNQPVSLTTFGQFRQQKQFTLLLTSPPLEKLNNEKYSQSNSHFVFSLLAEFLLLVTDAPRGMQQLIRKYKWKLKKE